MSVTQYTIGCGYELLKLKNTVFFLSKTQLKTINIDNGEAYAAINDSVSPNRLKGFNVKLTETESLDERYVFTKQLTMSINGHLTDSTFLLDDDYYIVVQTEDGTYYLVNVDFPSKMSFVYNLSEGQDQTDFTFVSNSNHPTLKLNWNPTSYNDCSVYQTFGIDSIKLLEKDYTSIDSEGKVINLFDDNEFKNIDYLKNTISLQENYDGKIATTTITFDIPFDNYKPSWQYNLLEFTQNLYTAHITPKNSTSGIFCGYEHGLQPSYEINGNTSIGESTSIKITLVEASEWGIFELDTWSYYRDSSKRWVGIDSEVKCIGLGVGINTLMQEVDGNGTPTQRYKCLEGYQNYYTNYNIVGTYTEDEVESFRTSVCTRFRTRSASPTGYYTCINGDKYELIGDQTSYDGGKHWIVEYYEVGRMVESGSSWCEIEPQYKWEISDEWECIAQFERWIPSGTTCILGDKYQNNYKQVSDDHVHWRDSDPLEWSASTVIEYDSEDCKIYRWTPTSGRVCEYDGITDYAKQYLTYETIDACSFSATQRVEYSDDMGTTWTLLEANTYTPTFPSNTKVMWRKRKTVIENAPRIRGNGGRYNVEGNIMSLIYGDGFLDSSSIEGTSSSYGGVFEEQFMGENIVSAENLVLAATTLAFNCYTSMFSGCTALTTPPELPVTTLAGFCYSNMFRGCTSLTTAPELPATTLDGYCYGHMFAGCTSLTTAPELPATTLAGNCYTGMFAGCTSLTTAPELLASTGVDHCYDFMFENCTSLNSITCLLTNVNNSQAYTFNWVENVGGNGTFIKASSANNWATGKYGIPNGWTVIDYQE